MAVANGFGKVVTSGSVFMYDTGDTVNSYIGEPTTNYQWNSGYEVTPWTVGGINTDVTNTVHQGPIKNAKTWKFEKTGTSNQWNGWESSYGGIWTGNAGDIWTTSYWYKAATDAGLGGFQVGAFYKSDWSAPYNCTVLANQNSIIADGQWHYNYTTTQFNENYSNAIIVDGPSWGYSGNSGVLYVNGLQWEKKSHSTPFAYGTRSATQGLLPIVGNSTIDLSNVSFDSNAQMTFDGTDDFIDTDFPAITLNTPTIEAVVYRSTNTGRYESIIQNNVASDDALYVYPNGTLGFWPCAASSLTVPTGQWSYVAVSYDGTNLIYCVNGVIQTITATCADITDWDFLRIGGFGAGDGERWIGKIAVSKVYDRALTANEFNQNYNKYKSRFNLA
jgi:hypothetical protein